MLQLRDVLYIYFPIIFVTFLLSKHQHFQCTAVAVVLLKSGIRNAVKYRKATLCGNSYSLREFRGVRSGVVEASALQRRDVLLGKMIPTVRGNVVLWPSRVNIFKAFVHCTFYIVHEDIVLPRKVGIQLPSYETFYPVIRKSLIKGMWKAKDSAWIPSDYWFLPTN